MSRGAIIALTALATVGAIVLTAVLLAVFWRPM